MKEQSDGMKEMRNGRKIKIKFAGVDLLHKEVLEPRMKQFFILNNIFQSIRVSCVACSCTVQCFSNFEKL